MIRCFSSESFPLYTTIILYIYIILIIYLS
nr:MAG TPA: hypothetical protein [Caudoviricetes sp.]